MEPAVVDHGVLCNRGERRYFGRIPSGTGCCGCFHDYRGGNHRYHPGLQHGRSYHDRPRGQPHRRYRCDAHADLYDFAYHPTNRCYYRCAYHSCSHHHYLA